jgi:hypothetical protein
MTWTETDYARDVTATFLGVTTPLNDLYDAIHARGWQVTKVKLTKGGYEAEAKSDRTGEKEKATGRVENAAVAALLMAVVRHNFIRGAALRHKVGMWQTDWTQQLQQIAEAYTKAPIYDPKAAGAFKELADDSVRRAAILGSQLKVEVVDDPEPYKSAKEMCQDVHQNKHFYVSRANCVHPVWSVEQNIAFRVVHDVMGHCVSGGDFGWQGENLACRAHFPLLSVNAQKALFTECIAQTAYSAFYRSFGPQKVCLLPEFTDDAQATENSPAHTGIHPSQSIAPTAMPPAPPSPPAPGIFPDHHVAPHMEGLGLTRVFTRRRVSTVDPNADWQADVQPNPNNAYQWHGDPLGFHDVMDNAAKIDTGWHGLTNADGSPDYDSIKQAVMNAFRVVLLSPRKDLKWNAIHYQDIAHIPGTVDDPDRYWDALEDRRVGWNVARKFHPDSHKPYFALEKQYTAYVQARDNLPHPQAAAQAKRELRNMLTQEQQIIEGEDAQLPVEKQLSANQIEAKAATLLKKRLQNMLKPKSNPATDYSDQRSLIEGYEPQLRMMTRQETVQPLRTAAAPNPQQIMMDEANPEGLQVGKYGAWMGSHLRAIASLSRHVDAVVAAALKDVHEHDGAGHHFRATVLSLAIPGVGPKVCSFAWLLLQPLTSQLATIDTHMMDVLGRDYVGEMNNRDYFKFEREFRARMDAAGYHAMPLGAAQWGMWDFKRTGPGTHQDHSAMRVLNPLPHSQIDWASKMPMAKGTNWIAPQWWDETKPAGDMVAENWDQTVAPNYPANAIPFQEKQYQVPTMASVDPSFTDVSRSPYYINSDAKTIVGEPNASLMRHIRDTTGLSTQDVWENNFEAGKK